MLILTSTPTNAPCPETSQGLVQKFAQTPKNPAFCNQLGRYAEFVVCAELTKLGYYVCHSDLPGFDIALLTEGKLLRVQVRSITSVKNGRCIWMLRKGFGSREDMRRSRVIDQRDADLIALYHHTFGTVAFVTTDNLPSTLNFPVEQVREHNTSESLRHALVLLAAK